MTKQHQTNKRVAAKHEIVFLDIPRTRRFTASDDHTSKRDAEAKRRATECLEAELQRLAREWNK